MRVIKLAVVVLASTLATGAGAQDVKTSGRYSMAPTDGGFLRLDTLTGQVSFCTKKADQFACNPVEDNKTATSKEVERLIQENKDLKTELAELRKLGVKTEPQKSLELPSEEEVDKAVSIMKKIIRGFKDVIEDEPPKKDKL